MKLGNNPVFYYISGWLMMKCYATLFQVIFISLQLLAQNVFFFSLFFISPCLIFIIKSDSLHKHFLTQTKATARQISDETLEIHNERTWVMYWINITFSCFSLCTNVFGIFHHVYWNMIYLILNSLHIHKYYVMLYWLLMVSCYSFIEQFLYR